jgi:hypothetical protein
MKAVKFLAKLLLGALAAVAVGTLIIGPFALSLWLFGEIRLHRDDRLPIISFADFLTAGGWMQAVVAWGTLVVTVVGATSIFFVRNQLKLDRERAERELFRPLISGDMQSVKRLINVVSIRNQLSELGSTLDEIETAIKQQSETKEQYSRLLADACAPIRESTRRRFNQRAARVKLPLLRGEKASLDHVEALLNEYNYLSKLILDKRLNAEFHTELGRENFRNVHRKLDAFIRLRRNMSPKYAVHFTAYVTQQPGFRSSVSRRLAKVIQFCRYLAVKGRREGTPR